MTFPDPPSLTPEERGFAQRLARVGSHGSPSPATDARILAAAHAAATAPARLRRRWPVALGMVASLVLAVGIAWRLRPLPETAPLVRPEAAAVRVQASAAASPPPAETPAENSLHAPADANGLSGTPSTPQPTGRASQTRDQSAGPAVARKSTAESTATLGQPAAPPAPIPPAAKAADVQVPHDAPQAFATPTAATPPVREAAVARMQQRSATTSETSPTDVTQEANTAAAPRGDEPLDDIPPATADSPAVRDAWLQRIHDLVDSGDIAGARTSLREFTRRYPAYPLPPDLTALQR